MMRSILEPRFEDAYHAFEQWLEMTEGTCRLKLVRALWEADIPLPEDVLGPMARTLDMSSWDSLWETIWSQIIRWTVAPEMVSTLLCYGDFSEIYKETEAETSLAPTGESSQEDMSLPSLLAAARIRPYYRDGRAVGFSVTQIKANSIYTKLGLKNEDVIYSVNEKQVCQPNDVLVLAGALKEGPVRLEVGRRGKRIVLTYPTATSSTPPRPENPQTQAGTRPH